MWLCQDKTTINFLEIAKQHDEKYNIVNNDNYLELAVMNMRWSLKGTKFISKEFNKLKRIDDYGLLDIFCFENVSDDDRKAKKTNHESLVLWEIGSA